MQTAPQGTLNSLLGCSSTRSYKEAKCLRNLREQGTSCKEGQAPAGLDTSEETARPGPPPALPGSTESRRSLERQMIFTGKGSAPHTHAPPPLVSKPTRGGRRSMQAWGRSVLDTALHNQGPRPILLTPSQEGSRQTTRHRPWASAGTWCQVRPANTHPAVRSESGSHSIVSNYL